MGTGLVGRRADAAVSDAQRRSFSWTAAIVIAVAAGAFVVGRLIPRDTAAPSTPPLAQPMAGAAPAASRTAGSSARTLDQRQLDAIRRAVRDEVNAAIAERDAEHSAEEPPAADESTPETPGNLAAAASAQALVEAARRSRRWKREDAASLRSAIAKMNAAQRDEILSTLIPAVNRGEIKPDYPGFLF